MDKDSVRFPIFKDLELPVDYLRVEIGILTSVTAEPRINIPSSTRVALIPSAALLAKKKFPITNDGPPDCEVAPLRLQASHPLF